MNKKPTGAIIIIPFLVAGSALPPYHKDPHTDPEPITPESTLYASYMDAAIISTFSGTTVTTVQFSTAPSKQFK
jgi:hypothetical protein